MEIKIEFNGTIEEQEVVDLYRLNNWSSAEKPNQLLPALRNSHTLVTARISGSLVGIANATYYLQRHPPLATYLQRHLLLTKTPTLSYLLTKTPTTYKDTHP